MTNLRKGITVEEGKENTIVAERRQMQIRAELITKTRKFRKSKSRRNKEERNKRLQENQVKSIASIER